MSFSDSFHNPAPTCSCFASYNSVCPKKPALSPQVPEGQCRSPLLILSQALQPKQGRLLVPGVPNRFTCQVPRVCVPRAPRALCLWPGGSVSASSDPQCLAQVLSRNKPLKESEVGPECFGGSQSGEGIIGKSETSS